MKAPIRPTLVVAIGFLLVVVIFGVRFAWNSAELWNFIQEDRRREQLQQHERSSSRHLESKKQVVRELIAQSCSLSEALVRMRDLDREWLQELVCEWPDVAIGISQMCRQQWSDAGYYYGRIATLAAELLSDRPEAAASVLHRLEEEHQRLQAGKQTPSSALMERTERSR